MNQSDGNTKICVVIIGGILENSLHPIPPIADGAPEWNVFRLAEMAVQDENSRLEIHVVSPCEAQQWEAVQAYPVKAKGYYHHVVFSTILLKLYRNVFQHIWLLRAVLSRLVKLPDVLSWLFLKRAVKIINSLQPDVVIINDRPQYVRYLRNKVAQGKLFHMVRGRIGDSRRHLNLLDGILVNSTGMKDYVSQFIEVNKPPVWKIPNALGNEFIVPPMQIDNLAPKEKIVLFSGRLIPEKGVRELLLAFRLVYEKCPCAKLFILGAYTKTNSSGVLKAFEEELRLLATEYPPGVVYFLGYVPNQKMGEYYRMADVAVFPSLPGLFESFGMVALEAMRCGVPVVASRQPGFEELIIPGKTGLLVEDPRIPEDLSQAILSILENSEFARLLGQAGYERSLRYTPEIGLRVLESILKNTKAVIHVAL